MTKVFKMTVALTLTALASYDDCCANKFLKDTCYTKIDSISGRTSTVCESERGKTPGGATFGDGPVYGPKYRTKTVTVFQGNKLVYKSYRKTRRNGCILHTLKWEVMKYNPDNTKETLILINKRYQYKHKTYDSNGKIVKSEIIDRKQIKKEEWEIISD